MINNARYYENKARKNLLYLEIKVQKAKSILAGERIDLMTKYSQVFGPKDCQSIMKEIDDCDRLTKGNANIKYPKTIMNNYGAVWRAESMLEYLEEELENFNIYMEMEKLGYDFDEFIYD